ncbi:hypothetical protein MMAGJ_02330 [Mycolicibacterium mageritense]|uniref:23S rRNA (Guanosine(2251)-2'-O)-methyltransferase RlmB n=1 Tax=Mycolicibacterium mageritense TaxID=53462 RepID=A0ABM7HKD5_MYCME|nr:hypothetical protein MMAGJ_02330 [Mycolicibacterium mageritense]CDO24701.1 hypothetical protein BN978_05201 [Mycolicibacterium mageritense DSM 44476 = CIP 104973]
MSKKAFKSNPTNPKVRAGSNMVRKKKMQIGKPQGRKPQIGKPTK